jgi:hypothetical protein
MRPCALTAAKIRRDAFARRRPYRDNKATVGTQQPRHFGERALGVADMVQPEVHDDRIKAAIGKVQVLGIAGAEGNVAMAALGDRQRALGDRRRPVRPPRASAPAAR